MCPPLWIFGPCALGTHDARPPTSKVVIWRDVGSKASQKDRRGSGTVPDPLGRLAPSRRAGPRGSAIRAGRHRRPKGRLGQVLAVRAQPKLSRGRRAREPPAAQREEPGGPRYIDAGGSKITRPADHRAAPRIDERACGSWTDPRHAHQGVVRRAGDLEWKALGMRECPRRLRIVVERQVAVAFEAQLVV